MASKQRSKFLGPFAVLAVLALCGCANERRFPLRDPIWKDGDLRPVRVACRAAPTKEDPRHVSCAPEPDSGSILWDGGDNLLFRPLSEALGIVVSGESVDVNSMDEVPDSSWFTNRIGDHPMSMDEFLRGDCEPEQLLDPDKYADGSWVIDKGKGGGSTDGFRVDIPGKGKYLLKADDSTTSEHTSAAQTVGATLLHAAGYPTSCEQVIYIKRSLLKLTPGLSFQHNFGKKQFLTPEELDRILAHCPTRGDLIRMQASEWLPGYAVGVHRFEGTRDDDPNDVIPHEDRRENRGMRLLAAWIDRFDTRSGNTFDSWVSEDPRVPDASPGHVIHYQIDTSEALGSSWDWDPVTRRLGHSYIVDWGDIAADFFTLGIPLRPWDTVEKVPGKEMFVFFNVDDFVPDAWKNEYPNKAYSRMTERDGAWMARILARFTPEQVHGLAGVAHFSDPDNTAYLEKVLKGRLAKILDRYLTRVSPLADVHVEGPDRVCAVDLAELRGVRPQAEFQYHARRPGGPWLSVERRPGAGVCVTLPHVAPAGGAPDDAPERYVRVRLQDGVAPGPLVAHLYDLGPVRGYRLAGLERPEE